MLITDKEKLKQYESCHRVWQGIPGIERTKNGRTFISLYSGNTKETYGNYAMVLMSDSDTDFSEPIIVAEKPGKYRCFDPVLWIDPLDRLWFIWNVMPGEEVFATICEQPDADTLVWSEPIYIGRGIMMNKPLVLSSGEWLFPIAIWKLDIYNEFRKSALMPEDVAGAYVYKTSDNGQTFVRLGSADIYDRSFDEHMLLELKNGVLMMLVRTNYGIGVSYSYNRGKNWSRGGDSGLGGPCSRFFIRRLRSGRVLLINHHNFTGRNNLTAFLSEDDGKTFPYSILLDERNKVAYPDAVEMEDGSIYIVYDRERGGFKSSLEEAYGFAREILTAKITEEDIRNGSLVSEGSFLKNVICKLGELCPTDPDPYIKKPKADRELAESLLQSDIEDVIGEVFEYYPVDCEDVRNLDAKKLDALIEHFQKSGNKDMDLLIQIIRFLRLKPQKSTENYPIIQKIESYIEEHLAEDLSVTSLAESMQISVYYLSHLFKSVTGTTITEYRNELRLTKSKIMLIETDKSINDIAQAVGFCSAAYFTEIFSKSEKIPPTEYRKFHKK